MSNSVQYQAPFDIWKCNIEHLRAAREYSKTIPHLPTAAKTAAFALLIFPFISAFEVAKNTLISIRNICALTVNGAHYLFYGPSKKEIAKVEKLFVEPPAEEKIPVAAPAPAVSPEDDGAGLAPPHESVEEMPAPAVPVVEQPPAPLVQPPADALSHNHYSDEVECRRMMS